MSIPEIDIHGAKEALDAGGTTFVDVRDPDSYKSAHVPGALHVNDHNVAQFVSEADKERPVIVYCYHGNSSLGGTQYFLNNGFKDVRSMSGGFELWRGTYESEGG